MGLLRKLAGGSVTRGAPPGGPEGRGWADACLPGAHGGESLLPATGLHAQTQSGVRTPGPQHFPGLDGPEQQRDVAQLYPVSCPRRAMGR